MTYWRALVVDEDGLARTDMRLLLTQSPGWVCVGACASVEEARAALAHNPADLLLLNLQQAGTLSLAAELADNEVAPQLVFTTTRPEQALRAFDAGALDCLLKPLDSQRFAAALQRAESALLLHLSAGRKPVQTGSPIPMGPRVAPALPEPAHIHVRSVRSLERVAVANLTWVRSAGNYVELHTRTGMVLHRSSLDALVRRLPPDQFLRVHRTAVVRAAAVTSLNRDGSRSFIASLAGGAQVPVSPRYVAQVRQLFG